MEELFRRWKTLAVTVGLMLAALPAAGQDARTCARWVRADVVALDQPWSWNRYGALEPQGMMYALRRDVVSLDDADGLPPSDKPLVAGNVRLRTDKRPRPLVLRVNEGDCLEIRFQNLLDANSFDDEAPHTRAASVHVGGLQPFTIDDDGSNVGTNVSSVVDPGGSAVYRLYAEREGTYLLHSMGAVAGGEGDGGSISAGLFGAVNVEPAGSVWYRSQVTREDLAAASTFENGYPRIDYEALYPSGTYAGQPVFAMLSGGEIVYSDLTAVIAYGANPGSTKVYPDRNEPFREFTIIFHDEIGAVQAFPHFYDKQLAFTLHGAREGFAINYGTGGAGAEILANRLGVGPVWDCVECKYEEFFLSSWAVGDPSMVVDIPANAPCDQNPSALKKGYNCNPTPGPKATKAFYPDDPSNVYHSYLNDNVKFRNLHAGTDDHHIFHLHAHQWLHTPKSDLSSYKDSEAIGQGAGMTYEITHGGSGNLNKTAGDSIFHCHFYPHFAQGMWSLWRVHDVLELGTELDKEGRPAPKSRALPDGEIATGTPIPAVVPMPTIAMAPLPTPVWIENGQVVAANDPAKIQALIAQMGLSGWYPGYPFFVPGWSGHRPPQPPLDTIHDGGLARHVVLGGTSHHVETRFDMRKELLTLGVAWIPETGDLIEKYAMDFHAQASHATVTPEGNPGAFATNGKKEIRGAPYADPCPVGTVPRVYKAANIQIDAVLNKAGWHFPQQRIITLWEDVASSLSGTRPPEPFFFRAHSGECVEFWHTNLVPNEYQLDDFQVRTPTDILGQHIHLVKFDVLASDGGGNGFNYEDGTMSPEEVQERICAIRRANNCGEPATGHCTFAGPVTQSCPVPSVHPFFQGKEDVDCDETNDWLGAQTTVQRWYADPILTSDNKKRTLRTVFTHDHFGPSTHQQVGLYAGLIVEEPGTVWKHNETGALLSTGRDDGGPTSWQAVISSPDVKREFREFMIEFADFQLAYEPGGPKCPDKEKGWIDTARAINPPGRKLVGPHSIYEKPDVCPTVNDVQPFPATAGPPLAPCPESVSADDPGTVSVNYRSEPVALRVRDPLTNDQASGLPGDLSFAYETRTDRADPEFNVLPYAPFQTHVPYPALTGGLHEGDPYTPLLRAYEGDRVVVRTLVGAHEEEHNFTIHGNKWLFEPHRQDSGWRNSQNMGISEWFDFEIGRVPSLKDGQEVDFLYKPTAAAEYQWNGAWGLVRVYRDVTRDLVVLSNLNPDAKVVEASGDTYARIPQEEAEDLKVPLGRATVSTGTITGAATVGDATTAGDTAVDADGKVPLPCPATLPDDRTNFRIYDITAVAAAEVLQNDGFPVPGLVYNRRPDQVSVWPGPGTQAGPLHDPTAIMFVYTSDLDYSTGRPRLQQNVRREPLVIRANAGECIRVTLRNDIWNQYQDQDGWNAVPMIVPDFNANDVAPSMEVGLHPQLVSYDIRMGDGANVGINPVHFGKQTVARGEKITYFWYAGDYDPATDIATPIEFGSTGLSSSDPVKHTNKGAIGALIVEPPGSSWAEDVIPEPHPILDVMVPRISRASVTVTTPDVGQFREYVLLFQDNVNLRYRSGRPVPSMAVDEDPAESAQKGVNYRTEPLWFRLGHAPDTPVEETRNIPDYHLVLSNNWINGADPETPVFKAQAGQDVRFRLVHPGGHSQAHVFDVHGHIWEETPYNPNSTRIAANPDSEWQGTRGGHGPSNHHEAVLKNGAGGKFRAFGDFLYRDYAGWLLDDGIWGLFRVE